MQDLPSLQAPSRRGLLSALACVGLAGVVAPARACDFYSATMRIWHPWTRATRIDAETAILCMRFDEVQRNDRLISVSTPVASGVRLVRPGQEPSPEPGISLDIAAGQELTLKEDGLHIELLDLQMPLQIGRSFPLQLGFEHGGLVNALLNVDYGAFR